MRLLCVRAQDLEALISQHSRRHARGKGARRHTHALPGSMAPPQQQQQQCQQLWQHPILAAQLWPQQVQPQPQQVQPQAPPAAEPQVPVWADLPPELVSFGLSFLQRGPCQLLAPLPLAPLAPLAPLCTPTARGAVRASASRLLARPRRCA